MNSSPATATLKLAPSRHVTAVLGPTNTGKTHLAIERMLGHESGLIGLPLRLLAREVYDRIVARVGPGDVALITGEEKIKPERPRYYVCTVEAMPREEEVDFLAIDEVQLAADADRGHVFTDRLFHSRGMSETLLLGAQTMAESIRELIPGANFISRPRLSKLTYSGQKKITRLPRRSAIVAFSATDVYAIAELIRRQRGGAAVVMGALSPRTRNAQVALYQSGDVDFIVATDAIGMGLNLDVDHVAFASVRKFDGRNHRLLTPSELAQIAGRAGRHLNDGTFGVTADVEPFDADLIAKLENHEFEPVKTLQWRNTELDFHSIERLKESLRRVPGHPRVVRGRTADDLEALELAGADIRIAELASGPAAVKRLWEVCQVPDYRKVAPATHAELVATLYKFIMSDEGVIPEDWYANQVDQADRTDGDIDTLSNRIAHIRTWTFVSNRREWLKDPDHWQARTRDIEDRLSDALHEQLTQRFVDKRTSVLMKSLRDKDSLFAEIEKDGRVVVEKHYIGKLDGFRFTPDAAAAGVHGKAARHAAAKVLVHELAARADRLAATPDTALTLSRDGAVMWEGSEIGRLSAGDDPLKPVFSLHSDEHLAASDKDNITKRIETWLAHYIEIRLKPLVEIGRAEEITGLARGIAFRLRENLGVVRRETAAEEIKSLDQEGRAQLRKYGLRFGAHNIYFPLLLKPAASDLLLLLWLLREGPAHNLTLDALAEAPRQGLTSAPVNAALPDAFYRAAGFHVCGARAVRVDMLERLADLIRPLTLWKPTETQPEPPPGAVGGGAFKIKPEMMSIMGCSSDEMGLILESLGYRKERRPARKATVAIAAEATAAAAAAPSSASERSTTADAVDATASTDHDSAGVAGSAANDNDAPPEKPAEPLAEGRSSGAALLQPQAARDEPDGQAAALLATGDIVQEAQGIAGEAMAAEPEFEEIWRFRRPKPKFERNEARGDRRRHQRRGEGVTQQGAEGVAAAGQDAGARPGGDRPFNRRGRDDDRNRQRRDGRAPDAPAREGEPAIAAQAPRHREGEQHRRSDRDNRRQQNAAAAAPNPQARAGDRDAGTQRQPQPHHGAGPRHTKDGGPRRDRRDEGRNRGPRPSFAVTAAPKNASPDADSPFAALSQLKEKLEKQMQTQE